MQPRRGTCCCFPYYILPAASDGRQRVVTDESGCMGGTGEGYEVECSGIVVRGILCNVSTIGLIILLDIFAIVTGAGARIRDRPNMVSMHKLAAEDLCSGVSLAKRC